MCNLHCSCTLVWLIEWPKSTFSKHENKWLNKDSFILGIVYMVFPLYNAILVFYIEQWLQYRVLNNNFNQLDFDCINWENSGMQATAEHRLGRMHRAICYPQVKYHVDTWVDLRFCAVTIDVMIQSKIIIRSLISMELSTQERKESFCFLCYARPHKIWMGGKLLYLNHLGDLSWRVKNCFFYGWFGLQVN